MKGRLLLAAAVALGLGAAPPPERSGAGEGGEGKARLEYDRWFTGAAMRVDLYHTASAETETVGLDEVVMEPVWAGTRKHLIDPFGYGEYRYRVRDAETGTLIFTQGFSSLLGEWRTTEEAGRMKRTMSESLRFPFPRRPVDVTLLSRDRNNELREIFSVLLDPASADIDRGRSCVGFNVVPLEVNGEPADGVDLVILPEGYTRQQVRKMHADAARFAEVLFDNEPFASRRDVISIRLVEVFSNESGTDEPRKSVFRDTFFDTSFNTFGAARYLTTADNKAVREAASRAPYDTAVVMVNTARYGGGGIYNSWSIFTSDNEYDDYVFSHELGHAFGGLADEYYHAGGGYDEDEFYPPGVEPWEPNLSAFLERKVEHVKWKDLIDSGVPIPTPNEKKWKGKVGVFEGGGYKSKGLFRGCLDCKMFHKGLVPFCAVCRRALENMIDYYSGSLKGGVR